VNKPSTALSNIPVVREQIKKCVRCGQCRTVCPIFREYQTENYAPRAQVFLVQMLRDGEVNPQDEKVAQKLGDCLLCESCTRNCPSAIPVHEMVAEARSYVAEQRPSAARNLVFDKLWSHPGRLQAAVQTMGLANALGLRTLARKLGLTSLLPGDLSQAEKILKNIPLIPAHSRLRSITPAQGKKKGRVAYFLGCGTDLLRPETALAAVNVLSRAGYDVVIPSGLRCCGLPHFANGEKHLAYQLAIHNLLLLKKLELEVDAVISDCASCTSALKSKRYTVEGLQEEASQQGIAVRDEVLKAAEWLQGRVIDLNAYLVQEGALAQLAGNWKGTLKTPVKVTYHDPCHLARVQGVRTQPREVIKSIEGIELVEMKEADVCCGGSGTFSLTHYDLSMKILNRKVENILATDAHYLATSCPSCMTQLEHGVTEAGTKIQVVHPVQLLDQALRKN